MIISFLGSLAWGVLVMAVVRVFTALDSPLPVNELVLSASFSVLVLSYVSLPQDKVLAYFYGTASGLLIYMVFFGLPL